jgi:hypothetical protein
MVVEILVNTAVPPRPLPSGIGIYTSFYEHGKEDMNRKFPSLEGLGVGDIVQNMRFFPLTHP